MTTSLDNPLISDHPMVSKDQRENAHNCVVAEFHHTLSIHEDDHGKVMDDKEFYQEEADWLAGKSLEPAKPCMSNRTARTTSATSLWTDPSSCSDAGCEGTPTKQTETAVAPPRVAVAVRDLSVPALKKKHHDLRTKMAKKQRDPFSADHEGLLSQVMALM